MFDRLDKYLAHPIQAAAGKERAVDLGAVFGPLLDLVEVARIRKHRVVGSVSGRLRAHFGWIVLWRIGHVDPAVISAVRLARAGRSRWRIPLTASGKVASLRAGASTPQARAVSFDVRPRLRDGRGGPDARPARMRGQHRRQAPRKTLGVAMLALRLGYLGDADERVADRSKHNQRARHRKYHAEAVFR